jgi:hypothetical protein
MHVDCVETNGGVANTRDRVIKEWVLLLEALRSWAERAVFTSISRGVGSQGAKRNCKGVVMEASVVTARISDHSSLAVSIDLALLRRFGVVMMKLF